jgi:hypothetical protein
MQGVYLGGYPWKNGALLTADDLNAAIALALSPVSIIAPGSITNVMLATPYVTIGTTQINLGATVTTLHGVLDPTSDLDVANKHYVDQHAGTGGGGGGIPDAPADSNYYGRLNAAWAQVVPLAGGVTIGGSIVTSGALTANAGFTVSGGETINGGTVIANGTPPLTLRQPAMASMPAGSGSTQSGSLIARLVNGTAGPTLDIGTNGSSGTWLDVTNTTDLSQRYPLLLQPLGGDTRMGGNVAISGSTTMQGLTVTGGITATGLGLTNPLPIASGGTANATQPLPANLAGAPAWTGAVMITTGTQIKPDQYASGYVATSVGFDHNIVAAANGSVLHLRRVNGSFAAPTAIVANDSLGGVCWNGWQGSAMSNSNPAAILMNAGSAWTPTNLETKLTFWTTPASYNVPSVALTLDGAGNGTFRGNVGAVNVTASGNITATGSLYTGGTVYGPAGSLINMAGATNFAFQTGTGNGQFLWYTNPGINTMALDNTGNLTINNSLIAKGSTLRAGNAVDIVGSSGSCNISAAGGGALSSIGLFASTVSVPNGGSLSVSGNISCNNNITAVGTLIAGNTALISGGGGACNIQNTSAGNLVSIGLFANTVTATAVLVVNDYVNTQNGVFYGVYGNSNLYSMRWDGTSLYCFVNSYGYITLATPSGRAVKREIAVVEDYDAMAALRTIPFYSYDAPGATLTDDGEWTETDHYACGWVAEDLEAAIPNSVDRLVHQEDSDAPDVLHPQWQPILAYAVRAIQQVEARLAALEARIASA